MAMTKMEMAQIIAPTLVGAVQSAASSKQNTVNQQQDSAQFYQQQQNLKLQQLLDQLRNQQTTGQSIQSNRQSQALAGLNASPLGQEQQYVQRQKLLQQLIPNIQNYKAATPGNPAIAKAMGTGGSNLFANIANPGMMQAVGDQATGQALTDRRKMLSMVNPGYEFSSQQNYGLNNPQQDQAVQQWQQGQLAGLTDFEGQQKQSAAQQATLAGDAYQKALMAEPSAATVGASGAKKKGSSIWSKLASVAKVAAPIVLAATGVGAPASAAIMAGTYAAGKKASGGSWGDALKSGVIGGATGAIGAGALGSASRAGMSAATQRAVAQGALQGLDTKTSGGSWNDALTSGITGAATSKAQDWARGTFQGQGPQMNNQMGIDSKPVGSFSAPQGQLNLQATPNMQMTGFAQPAMQNPASPQVSKLQQIISGVTPGRKGTPSTPTVDPSQFQASSGTTYDSGRTPQMGQSSMTGGASQIGPQPGGKLGALLGSFQDALQQQPAVRVMQSPMGALMAGAVMGQIPQGSYGQVYQPQQMGQQSLPYGNQPPQLSGGAPQLQLRSGTPQLNAGQSPELGPFNLGNGQPPQRQLPGQTVGQRLLGPGGSQPTGFKMGANAGGGYPQLPQFTPSTVNQMSQTNQVNAQKILQTLSSATNGMTPQQKAQFLADPQAQKILQMLQGGR